MQDTIHLGWRGWVAVDKVVEPFLTKPQKPDTYRIQPYFFSKGWTNAQ
jgi:D-alanine transfer protein